MKINGEFKNNKTQSIIDKHNWSVAEREKISSKEVKEHDDNRVSHLSNCLVTVSPIQEKEPFQLFGSLRKSIVANKISIYEALTNPSVIGDVKKGRLIAEAFVSDEVLSRALIEQGSSTLPCTISQLDGTINDITDILPLGNSVDRSTKNANQSGEKTLDMIGKSLNVLSEELSKSRPAKKATEAAIRTIQSAIYNLSANSEYQIETLIENLKSDVNSFRFEMENTIQKLNFYKNVESINLLDYGNTCNYDESFLSWYAKGGFNSMEQMTLVQVLKALHEKENNPKLQKLIENKSHRSTRETGDITDGSIEFNTVYGDTSLSDEENLSGRSLEMRIGMATAEEDYKVRFNKYRELFRVSFSITDLVRLMRGTGEQFVSARITRFANQSVPYVKLQKFVKDEVNINHKDTKENNQTYSIFADLKEIFESGSIKKADKEKGIMLINQLNDAVVKQHQKQMDKVKVDQTSVSNIFEDKLRTELEETLKTLPAPVAKKALLLLKK